MLHVIVGNSDADLATIRGLSASRVDDWVVPKRAAVGDDLVIYFGNEGFVARARVASDPLAGRFGSQPAYRSSINGVALLQKSVPLSHIAAKMPDWKWVSQRSKSRTTPAEEDARRLLELIESYQPNSNNAAPVVSKETSTASALASKLASARTFLLTWNPNRWDWENRADVFEQVAISGSFYDRWTVGNRVDLPEGSRLFLMRLGSEPKGLVGSGWSISTPQRVPLRDEDLASVVETSLSVGVEFDVLEDEPVVKLSELAAAPFNEIASWTPRSSGVELPRSVRAAIETLWAERTGSSARNLTERSPASYTTYPEGAVRRIWVNAYERNAKARRDCIQHYGTECHVCGFSFGKHYGKRFEGFIQVHHLKPISSIGESYNVDPVEDLRPVCANCHAAIHFDAASPMSIDEMRLIVAAGRKGRATNNKQHGSG